MPEHHTTLTQTRHAFLIIAHHEPEVLRALLSQLDHPRADIYLHIDARADALYAQAATWRTAQARLTLMEERLSVYWGDVSQVQTELILFARALADGPHAYYHLLSGVDQLTQDVAQWMAFCDARQGTEFVHFFAEEKTRKELTKRIGRYHLFTLHLRDKHTLAHRLTTPVRNTALALQCALGIHRHTDGTPRKGSNWVSITEDFCRYLTQRAPQIARRYRHTLCGDEIFLQTALWNSPFRHHLHSTADDIAEASLRAIDWERGSPYTYRAEDAEALRKSKAFVARKFDGSFHL